MQHIGLISGTSMDAIDSVLVDLNGGFRLIASHAHPIPEETLSRLQKAQRDPEAVPLGELADLDLEMGELFAEAALSLLERCDADTQQIRAIGSHGQTVLHRPQDSLGSRPYSCQIGDPNVIAARTGITTVADFRRRDVALGGQGAPLVPGFHAAMFTSPNADRIIVNLGGIANLTLLLRARAVGGYDTGPANTLMDRWVERHLGQPMDRDGAWAAGGKVNEPLLQALLSDPYFTLPPPKSTGQEYFHLDWLKARYPDIERIAPQDVQASLLELTACSISDAILASRQEREELEPAPLEVFLCGGGVHNAALRSRLAQRLPGISVQSTRALGLDPDWVEASAFAWMAHRTLEGLPGNVISVTGAKAAAPLGAIYPA